MNMKTRLFIGLLWALAAYFAYVTVTFLQAVAVNPATVSNWPLDLWVRQLVYLAAIVIYPYMSSPSRRERLLGADGRVRLFQVFSGLLAGFQITFLNPLFMERVRGIPLPNHPVGPVLWALIGVVLIACVLSVAFTLTRTRRRWLLTSFVVTASFMMAKTNGVFYMFSRVDSDVLFAGGGLLAVFAVCAYFFPGPTFAATRAVSAGIAALFAVVFSGVGGKFGSGRR